AGSATQACRLRTGSSRHPAVLVAGPAVRRRPVLARGGPAPAGHAGLLTRTARRGGLRARGGRTRVVASGPPGRGGRRTGVLLAVVSVVHAVRLADPLPARHDQMRP